MPSLTFSLFACAALLVTDGNAQASALQNENRTHQVHLWVVSGTEEANVPVAGIRVALGVVATPKNAEHASQEERPRFLSEETLAYGTSDEAGVVAIDVPVPKSLEEKSYRLWARVESPGYAQTVRTFSPKPISESEPKLFARRGTTFFGRCVKEDGTPVENARGGVFRSSQESLGGLTDKTNAGGRFAFDIVDEGRYVVSMHHKIDGSLRGEYPLNPAIPKDLGDLVMLRHPEIEGVLRDPDGQPIAGIWIQALPTDLERLLTATDRNKGRIGFHGKKTVSDSEGRFAFPSLMPGEYSFYGSHFGGHPLTRRKKGEWIDTIEVTGTEPIELEFGFHRIEIRILEADGAPMTTKAEDAFGRNRHLTLRDWNDLHDRGRGLIPSRVGDRWVFKVEPETEYYLCYRDPEAPLVERRISMGETHLVSERIQLGERRRGTELTVEVANPDGVPQHTTLSVFSMETGQRIRTSEDEIGCGLSTYKYQAKVTLAPGQYIVRGQAIHRTLPKRAPYAPVEESFYARAGESHTLSLQLEPAGYIDMVQGLPPDRQATSVEAQAGRLFLVNKNRRLLLWCYEEEVLWSHTIRRGQAKRILDGLPEGTWSLRLETEGAVLFEQTVRIEAGKTTQVAW